MKAGVQPLKRNLGPSSRRDWTSICGTLALLVYPEVSINTQRRIKELTDDMTLDLITSAGEQMAKPRCVNGTFVGAGHKNSLVDTIPARLLAEVCRRMLS